MRERTARRSLITWTLSVTLFATAFGLLFMLLKAAEAKDARTAAWLSAVRPALPAGAHVKDVSWYRGSLSLLAVVLDRPEPEIIWADASGRIVGRFQGPAASEDEIAQKAAADVPGARVVRITPGWEADQAMYEVVLRLPHGGVGYRYYGMADGELRLSVIFPPR